MREAELGSRVKLLRVEEDEEVEGAGGGESFLMFYIALRF